MGVSAATVDRTRRKLENCEDESCQLQKAGSGVKYKKMKVRQLVQLELEINHQTGKSKKIGRNRSFRKLNISDEKPRSEDLTGTSRETCIEATETSTIKVLE